MDEHYEPQNGDERAEDQAGFSAAGRENGPLPVNGDGFNVGRVRAVSIEEEQRHLPPPLQGRRP